MTAQVGFTAAFLAGIVSFLSPCVLPLIPAYISFMTGMSIAELTAEDRSATRIVVPVLLFVAGFTIVFVGLGASASALGAVLSANREILSRVAGVMIVFLGFVLLDIVPLPWLRGRGLNAAALRRFGPWAALALGIAFPFALGPCAGPVYGAILTLALDSSSVGQGAALLLMYSFGLAIPFVVVSLLLARMTGLLRLLAKHSRTIDRVAGAVLIVMGLAMAFGIFDAAGSFLQTLPLLRSLG